MTRLHEMLAQGLLIEITVTQIQLMAFTYLQQICLTTSPSQGGSLDRVQTAPWWFASSDLTTSRAMAALGA